MFNNFKNKLENDGYYNLKDCISNKYIEFAKKYINNKVNYTKIEDFIYNVVINILYNKTDMQLKITKYRVSNNNNSTDASIFHRDIQVMNNNITQSIPIYTILVYLDNNSYMEVIPGSHKKYRMTILEAANFYNKSIELNINPGDILIMNACLIHKGIFYNSNKNRRLIQCFDCIPVDNYNYYNNKILHLPCLDRCFSKLEILMIFISKIEFLIKKIDFINYLNTATGYNCKTNFMKNLSYKNIDFLSSEANNKRLVPKQNKLDIINRYIIKIDNISCQKKSDITKIYLNSMLMFYIYIYIYILVIIIILFFIIYYII